MMARLRKTWSLSTFGVLKALSWLAEGSEGSQFFIYQWLCAMKGFFSKLDATDQLPRLP